MPIKLADDLPALPALAAEGVMVMRETDAIRQDIRPLRIGLLNLMPDRVRTEIQIARLIASTPLQVEMTLIRTTDHRARNVPLDYLTSFYRPWEDIRSQRFDGFIVTGAPVEHLPFEEVPYWNEFRRILDWTQTNVHRCFNICWAAQGAMYHFHGIRKHLLEKKILGVFTHRNLAPTSMILQGLSDEFLLPIARWTELSSEEVLTKGGVKVLLDSPDAGICLLQDECKRSLHMFSHPEYDKFSLRDEYIRDSGRPGLSIPYNYVPDDDLSLEPRNNWRSHAHLLFANWINEIYQSTPFDTAEIGAK